MVGYRVVGYCTGYWVGPFSGPGLLPLTVFSRARPGLCRQLKLAGLASVLDLRGLAVFSEAMMNPHWGRKSGHFR